MITIGNRIELIQQDDPKDEKIYGTVTRFFRNFYEVIITDGTRRYLRFDTRTTAYELRDQNTFIYQIIDPEGDWMVIY